MSPSDFIPTLQPMVESVSLDLRFICYFILTASIIAQVTHYHYHESISTLMRPIVTATIITGLIATLPMWFNLVRDTFWNISMTIRGEYAPDMATTSRELLALLKPPQDGVNWLDVIDSLVQAIQFALGWLIVCIGALIQLPMLLVQYVVECLCYLFLPIALSLLTLNSTKGLGIRYLQQTLAILAWPIGFAVVDLVGYSLLTSSLSGVSAGALAVGLATSFTPAKLIVGALVAIWLLLGSLATPVIMQMLFCSGSPMSSLVGQSIQMGLMAAGMMRLGGATNPTPPTTPSGSAGTPPAGGGAGGSGNAGAQSPPPEPPPTTPGTTAPHSPNPTPTPVSGGGSTHNSPPHGFTQPAPQSPLYDPLVDPTGDRQSADLMAMTQIYKPVRY